MMGRGQWGGETWDGETGDTEMGIGQWGGGGEGGELSWQGPGVGTSKGEAAGWTRRSGVGRGRQDMGQMGAGDWEGQWGGEDGEGAT